MKTFSAILLFIGLVVVPDVRSRMQKCENMEVRMKQVEKLALDSFDGEQRRCVICTESDCTYCHSTGSCKLVDESCPQEEKAVIFGSRDRFQECKRYKEKMRRYVRAAW